MVFELAHWLGIVPLAWLAVRRSRDVAYWWLALAFAVSWLADTMAHVVDPWLAALVFPVSQAAIIGAVFLPRREAVLFAVVLALTGAVAALIGAAPDVLLPTVAGAGIVRIVWDRPALGALRDALLVTFGAGTMAWWYYALSPGWASWSAYQTVRLVGTLLFCVVTVQKPKLALA